MYLGLQQVGAFAQMGIAIGILQLQTALGVKPPLQAGYVVGLLVVRCLVLIEVVVGGDEVQLVTDEMHVGRGIITVALHTAVFSCQVFTTQVQLFELDFESCRPAVTRITVAYVDVGVDVGSRYSTSCLLYTSDAADD